jgi:hypothetical protein
MRDNGAMSLPVEPVERVEPAPVAPQPRAAAGGARWRQGWALEASALASFLGVIWLLRASGLRMDLETLRYTLAPMAPMLPRALLAGLVLHALYLLVGRRHWRAVAAYGRQILSWRWGFAWLRLWLAAMLMTYAYFWLKVAVPLLNRRLWDESLWRLDALLHGGASPAVFIAHGFAGTPLVALLDVWYSWWIPSVFYTMAFFAVWPLRHVSRQFMLSCVLLWSLGAWLYLAVPALGPIYVDPAIWQPLAEDLPRARAGQQALWDNYGKMIAGRETGVLHQFNPTRGIAALPSLHVAAHALFALWSRRVAPRLYVPFLIATLLTFLGSLVTGWHYAVDGYLGILLAWCCYRLALLLEQGPPHRPRGDAVEESG